MAEAPINKDSIRDFISAIALLLAKQLDTWGDAFIGLRKEDTKPRTIVNFVSLHLHKPLRKKINSLVTQM